MAIEDALMLDLSDGDWIRQAIEQRKQFGGGDDLPRHVYRYVAPGTSSTRAKLEDALVNSRLYLCSRTQFNDPFDSRLEWLQPSNEEVRSFLQDGANRHGFSPDQVDQVENELLSAPQNWRRINDCLNGTLDTLGLACFSETPRDMLMWSHYGASHTGVVIEYEAFDLMAGMRIFPVVYASDFPSMLLNARRSADQLFRSVLYKAKCWSYELEWRVVRPGEARSHAPLNSERVSAIYLGCKIEEGTLGLIRELLVARGKKGLPEVRVLRMYMQADAFALVAQSHTL